MTREEAFYVIDLAKTGLNRYQTDFQNMVPIPFVHKKNKINFGIHDHLWISSKPNTSHSAYIYIKAVASLNYCTRNEICNVFNLFINRYWTELRKNGYIIMLKYKKKNIYAITDKGKKFIEEAEKNLAA